MSRPRLEFKELLDTLSDDATVYGQAPGKEKMVYPAIMYEKSAEEVERADNLPYLITDGYQVTVIERDPNTPVAKMVRVLPMCAYNTYFVVENLHHTVYTIYF